MLKHIEIACDFRIYYGRMWSIGDSNSRLLAWSGRGSGAPLAPNSLPCPFESRHRGFALGCGLGQGAALRPHCGLIHHRARSNPLIPNNQNGHPNGCPFRLVEHRGFEPLTSTLRTLRATNCANAPRMNAISIIHIRVKKARRIFTISSRSTGCPSGARRGRRPPPWRRGRPASDGPFPEVRESWSRRSCTWWT